MYLTDQNKEKVKKTIKSILNKLTNENFDRLLTKLLALGHREHNFLDEIFTQIFEKAISEPKFCEIYVNLLHEIKRTFSNPFNIQNESPSMITQSCEKDSNMSHHLHNLIETKCKIEFEKGQRKAIMDIYSSNKKLKKLESKSILKKKISEKNEFIKQRAFGNIYLIGQLYCKQLLTTEFTVYCIQSLLKNNEDPNPEDVEKICILMKEIRKTLNTSTSTNSKEYSNISFKSTIMKTVIQQINYFRKNTKIDLRLRFLCQDILELWEVCGNS